MTEQEQLTALCEQLGASRAQAAVMAAQLLKRADQLAVQRGMAREAALKSLLEVLVKGRAGEVPPAFGSANEAPRDPPG